MIRAVNEEDGCISLSLIFCSGRRGEQIFWNSVLYMYLRPLNVCTEIGQGKNWQRLSFVALRLSMQRMNGWLKIGPWGP